ncbi:MAG: polysaccharide biosynthesis tyrosine autokinase [Nitrospira sp.]|nr:polysaccharide biosynthesis tyrosine autokinase [Nitrospira sp.]
MLKKSISIQDCLEIFLRRKWSFFIPFTMVALMTGVLAYVLSDIYLSTTMIFVEPQKVPESFVRPTITAKVEDRLRTTTQHILSRTKLEKIVQEHKLYQGAEDSSRFEEMVANLPVVGSYWSYTALSLDAAVERIRKDITVNVKGDNILTIAYQGIDPQATMLVTNKLASLIIEENLKIREQQAEGTSEFLENELNNSRLLLERQEKQIKDFKQRNMGELPEQLESNLRALDRFQLELKSTVEALKAAEDRRESVAKLLATAQSGVGTPGSSLAARLEELKARLSNLLAEYKEDYPDIILIRKEIKEIEEALASGKGSTNRSNVKDAMLSSDPFIHDLARQLTEVSLEISTLKNRQANLTKQITIFEKRVENTPLREQQLMTIIRDYDNIRKNYQSLLDKRLEAKISENLEKRQQGEIFRILDPPNHPQAPFGPNRGLIVLVGLLLASGSGIGLILLREQLDQSFKTEEELSEIVGMPVLATFPHQPLLQRRPNVKVLPAPRGAYKIGPSSNVLVQKAPPALLEYIVSIHDPSPVTVEQFRVLHTWIEQAYKTKGWKIFCVTSAVKGEGKTFTAVNLAVTMAKDFGRRTLLMDMDCKGTMLEKLVDRDDQVQVGWANMVQQKGELHEALIPLAAEKLFLLPTGKVSVPSSSLIALLNSSNLLQELRRQFDYIVMDAPPILPLADMRLIADLVDGIVLVVRSEKTNRDLGLKASSSVPHDKILGFVLNGVKRDFKHYYYYGRIDSSGGKRELKL